MYEDLLAIFSCKSYIVLSGEIYIFELRFDCGDGRFFYQAADIFNKYEIIEIVSNKINVKQNSQALVRYRNQELTIVGRTWMQI